MDTFVSTINFKKCISKKNISELLKNLKGDYNIEISSGHIYNEPVEKAMNALMEWSNKYNRRVMLHNFSPPDESNLLINLSHIDKNYRRKVKNFIKKRIEYTKELGSDYYSFHGGYTVDYEFGKKQYHSRISHEEALEIFFEELSDIVNYAEKKEIAIGIENAVVEKGNEKNLLFGSYEDFKALFDLFESSYLYLHLDFGHLNVSSNILNFNKYDFVEKFSNKIKAVHLHENNGITDEHKSINSYSWFLPLLKKIPSLNYIILETSVSEESEINKMLDLLNSSYL